MSKTIKRESTKGFIQHLEHELKERKEARDFEPVSYTHLTLPTILRV